MRSRNTLMVRSGLGLLACVTAAAAAHAQLPTVGPTSLVARQDIFANCTADHVGSQPGTVYPRTHIEPNLAINPANPKNLVVGLHQDRWSNGGARGMRGAYSADGGVTWTPTDTPGVTQCQGGFWPRSSDPWISFSPDGTAYFSQLVTETLTNEEVFGRSGQVVSQSVDGGLSWGAPTTLVYSPSQPDTTKPQILHDKNSVFADDRNSNLAYVVWDKLISFTPGAGVTDEKGEADADADAAAEIHAAVQAAPDAMAVTRRLHAAALKRTAAGAAAGAGTPPSYPTYVQGPTLFARTYNHGKSWEPARTIVDPGDNNQTIGNQIVRLPDGRLANFFTFLNDLTGAQAFGFVTSGDNGKTWSKPYYPETATTTPALTPNKQEDIRSADILFSVATDLKNGLIWLTWEDTRYSGVNEVSAAFSQDGYSWYGPVKVNQTPRNPSHPYFQQGLIPTVSTTDDGTAVITYYDFRNDKVGAATDLADYWAVVCNPFVVDCTATTNWHKEVKVDLFAFDYNSAPVAGGHFLGDYMGLKTLGQTAHAVFGVSEAPNKTTLYTRAINVPVSFTPSAAATARVLGTASVSLKP